MSGMGGYFGGNPVGRGQQAGFRAPAWGSQLFGGQAPQMGPRQPPAALPNQQVMGPDPYAVGPMQAIRQNMMGGAFLPQLQQLLGAQRPLFPMGMNMGPRPGDRRYER